MSSRGGGGGGDEVRVQVVQRECERLRADVRGTKYSKVLTIVA
jgi:hypothetical protein